MCVCVYLNPLQFIAYFVHRYISGSMHYSRVLPEFWKDRLQKFVAGGLNAVQTYVPWNFHETVPGLYDFDGRKNLLLFIKTAQEVGLLVIVRAGPYICAEWDMGGFPSWLLADDDVVLRSSNSAYLKYVDRWMGHLLPLIKPYLYENGGPIISVQVENEYGYYYTCDEKYLKHLHNLFRSHLGNNVILFTTDSASPTSKFECGTDPSLFYSTIDFGSSVDPAEKFAVQRKYAPHGPLVNSEFYTGWLDNWSKPHQRRDSTLIAKSLDAILKMNASVNLYMYIGGTNFEFWNGADASWNSTHHVYDLSPVPTSYDYDAPLTEAGDPWEKFTKIRDIIKKYRSVPSTVPSPSPKSAYGKAVATKFASLFNNPQLATNSVTDKEPISMEKLGQSFGFINYTTVITSSSSKQSTLTVIGCNDRGVVFVNREFQGILTGARPVSTSTLQVSLPQGEATLTIIVENMGRINFGKYINDSKGIVGGVYLDNDRISGHWISQPLPMNNTSEISFLNVIRDDIHPLPTSSVFYQFTFNINGTPTDTYLDVNNWSKGVAFVNGFNIGRYWPHIGPQKTLYVPSNVLKSGVDNVVVLFETEAAPCVDGDLEKCSITLTDTPNIG